MVAGPGHFRDTRTDCFISVFLSRETQRPGSWTLAGEGDGSASPHMA